MLKPAINTKTLHFFPLFDYLILFELIDNFRKSSGNITCPNPFFRNFSTNSNYTNSFKHSKYGRGGGGIKSIVSPISGVHVCPLEQLPCCIFLPIINRNELCITFSLLHYFPFSRLLTAGLRGPHETTMTNCSEISSVPFNSVLLVFFLAIFDACWSWFSTSGKRGKIIGKKGPRLQGGPPANTFVVQVQMMAIVLVK